MPTIPGTENLSPAVKYVIAFAIIFLLLALFALILRRLTGGRNALSSERGRARQPRLGIVDVYDLDRQRQLILLRRDNVEHLLLIGGPNDVVVETNIVRVPGARLPSAQTAELADPADAGKPARNGEGGQPRPVVGGTVGPADILPGARSFESAGTSLDAPKPARAPVVQPPTRPAPKAAAPDDHTGPMPDMTRELEATLRRAHEPRPTPQPAPPQPLAPKPPEAARPVAPPPSRPVPQPARQDPPIQPATRQEPPPRREAPAQPATRPEPPKQEASRQEAPRQEAPRQEPPRQEAPRPVSPSPRPEPVRSEPPRPEPPKQEQPTPRPEPARPAPKPEPAPAPPSPAPASASKPDPFSIEDIEAEFARLLGRPLDKKD